MDNEANCSDEELARMAAAGDAMAFREIHTRYHRRVYSIALRMTRNEADAEDLTQESFLSVFRKVGSFRGDSAFTTWLYRLVVNQVKMHFRYQSSRPEVQTNGDMQEQAMAFPHREQSVQLTDRLALEEAVQSLPPGYRKVFILHDLEGYKHNESGRLLGHSAGTSKSQLHRARVRLRQLLSDGPSPLPVRLRCPTAT